MATSPGNRSARRGRGIASVHRRSQGGECQAPPTGPIQAVQPRRATGLRPGRVHRPRLARAGKAARRLLRRAPELSRVDPVRQCQLADRPRQGRARNGDQGLRCRRPNLSPEETTQDFVLNSHPVMVAPDTREFLGLLKAMDAGGLRAGALFPDASAVRHRRRARGSSRAATSTFPTGARRLTLFGLRPAVKLREALVAAAALPSLTHRYLSPGCAARPPVAGGRPSSTSSSSSRSTSSERRSRMPWSSGRKRFAVSPRRHHPHPRPGHRRCRDRAEVRVGRLQSVEQPAGAPSPLGNMNRARKEIYNAMAAYRASRGGAAPGSAVR